MISPIRVAAVRSAAYQSGERAPAALAAAVVAPAALVPYEGDDVLAPLLRDVATAQAVDPLALAAALGSVVWEYPAWVTRISAALSQGSLMSASMLIAAMPPAVADALTPAGVTAARTVLASRTLRLVDVVAAEMGVPVPASVTAADVTAALAAA